MTIWVHTAAQEKKDKRGRVRESAIPIKGVFLQSENVNGFCWLLLLMLLLLLSPSSVMTMRTAVSNNCKLESSFVCVSSSTGIWDRMDRNLNTR